MESVAPEPLFQAHGSFVVVACFEKRGLPLQASLDTGETGEVLRRNARSTCVTHW